MKKIGDVELDNPFLAAPMAGITDAATRTLCREMGAALTYSEMISAKGLIYGNYKTRDLLMIGPGEGKVAFQIFGGEPAVMGEAAEALKGEPNVILDLNMGCPVPKVVKNGEGAALLKDLDRLYRITEICVKKAGKPVTVKIRKGWDSKSIVGAEAAKAAEAAGAAAVTIHGRTREELYRGTPDKEAIKRVKNAVGIPVIGSGDIFSGEAALKMMEETGCDAVMIARGMLGNPWIFREALALLRGEEKPLPPTLREKGEMMMRHYELLKGYRGEKTAVKEMRKHVGWYIKGEANAVSVRRAVNKALTQRELKEIIDSIQRTL